MKRSQRVGGLKLLLSILGLLSVISSACTASSASSGADAPSQAAAKQAEKSAAPDRQEETATAGSSQSQTGDSSDHELETEAQGPGLSDAKTSLKPRPVDLPEEMKVAVSAKLSPVCVEPGSRMVLEVRTESQASIAYQAVYAGNKGGSDPPFGEGYGGNDKGTASKEGHYESTWIVRADAPAGPARVDVVVAYVDEFGYTGPHFAVADKNGKCPSRWLKSGPDGA